MPTETRSGILFFRSLRTRLTLGFALVILFCIGTVILTAELYVLVSSGKVMNIVQRRQAYRLAPVFAEYHRRNGSWDGVTSIAADIAAPIPLALTPERPLLRQGPPKRILALLSTVEPGRLILSGPAYRVVADTAGILAPGESVPPNLRAVAVSVPRNGPPVGRLISLSRAKNPTFNPVRRLVRRLLFLGVLLSGIASVFLGLFFAHRLTRSLRALDRAARRFTAEETFAPLPVRYPDEVGSLTRTFNEMMADLNRQRELQKRMVADIAHELRSPLSVMRLDVEALADGLQSPVEAARSLQEEMALLDRLIEDLRQLSLADAGALRLETAPLEPGPFLARLTAAWAVRADASRVTLSLDAPGDLPTITADENRLAQVFHNLLSNALRHTPAGKEIRIGARLGEDRIHFWVKDSGSGIAPEHLPHIFERFYRADASRSRNTGGTGLGLAIAKQLVRLHGGEIQAENEGDGARFAFFIPMNSTDKTSRPIPSAKPPRDSSPSDF